jgi:hypothetical protein
VRIKNTTTLTKKEVEKKSHAELKENREILSKKKANAPNSTKTRTRE